MAEEEQPQKQLESGQGLLQGFGGLDGIEPPKEVHVRGKTAFEKLLLVGEESIKKYAQPLSIYTQQATDPLAGISLPLSMVYNELSQELKEDKLNGVLYSEDDLKNVILANVNRDQHEDSAKILGLYTSVLLEMLMDRHEKEGKQRTFYINGSGDSFNYLFCFARNIDELVVDNFCGNFICGYAGSYSKIGRIIGMNLKGINVLNDLGYKGIIKQAIGVNIEGGCVLSDIVYRGIVEQVIGINISVSTTNVLTELARKGKANQIIGVDIKGRAIFENAGSLDGFINQLTAVNIIGNELFNSIASQGKVNQVLVEGASSGFLFSDAVQCGHINQIALCDISRVSIFLYPSRTIMMGKDGKNLFPVREIWIDEVVLCHSTATTINDEDIPYGKLVTGKEAEARFLAISEEAHLEEITALCRAMKTAGYPKVLEIADKLYALRPAVPDGFFEGK